MSNKPHSSEQKKNTLIFQNVIFWINPNIDSEERATLIDALTSGGARNSESSETADKEVSKGKIRGLAINVPPGLEFRVYRFPFFSNLKTGPDGAESLSNDSATNSSIQTITHVITKDIHFPEYLSILGQPIKIITPTWVHHSLRFNALQDEKFYNPHPKNIFSGLIVTASQLPVNDREALYGGILAYGGQYKLNLSKAVTHLVLLTGTGGKYDQVMANPKLKIKVILPHWFEQCINLGILVDEKPYLFPDPQIFNLISRNPEPKDSFQLESENTENTTLDKCDTINQVERHFKDTGMLVENENASSNPEGLCFLGGYNISFSIALLGSIDQNLIKEFQKSIESFGGTFVLPSQKNPENSDIVDYEWTPSLFNKIDILVCQSREGYDYYAATLTGKLVGSLVWLIKILKLENLFVPSLHIFDYPILTYSIFPQNPNTEKSPKYVIGLSGYFGAKKAYLQRLVTNMGGLYAPKLAKDVHTHLVASDPTTTKFESARGWNCHVINHLWLENSFQEQKVLSITHPNFTYWPPLSEIALNSVVGKFDQIKPEVLKESIPTFHEKFKELLVKSPPPSDGFDNPERVAKNMNIISISQKNELLVHGQELSSLNLSNQMRLFIFLAETLNFDIISDLSIIKSINEQTLYPEVFNSEGKLLRTLPSDDSKQFESVSDSSEGQQDHNDTKRGKNKQLKKELKDELISDGIANFDGSVGDKTRKTTNRGKLKGSVEVQMEAVQMYEKKLLPGNSEPLPNKSLTRGSRSKSSSKDEDNQFHETSKLSKKSRRDSSLRVLENDGSEPNGERTSALGNAQKNKKRRVLDKSSSKNSVSVSSSSSSSSQDLDNLKSSSRRAELKNSKSSDMEIENQEFVNLIFTQANLTDSEEKQIKKMGGHITASVKNATHLVSNGIKRTSKFLQILTEGNAWIVSPQWLSDSISLKRWIKLDCENPPDDVLSLIKERNNNLQVKDLRPYRWWWQVGYGIQDREIESKYNFKLESSFYSARTTKLFENVIFYVTPNVQPPIDTLKLLIKSGNGTLKQNLSARKINDLISFVMEGSTQAENETSDVSSSSEKEQSGSSGEKDSAKKLVVISCEQDKHLWAPFLSFPDVSVTAHKKIKDGKDRVSS
ncbi:hypothetical protein BB560_005025, partial [Smittium megazygosporum]